MDKLDYKKQYKELYLPKNEPSVITVPPMIFLMVDGKGNPNDEKGEYQQAVELLYALTYTIKMIPKNNPVPEGYYEYVVPPLEGLWWMSEEDNFNFSEKDKYCWTSMIRQPEFVTQEVFDWSVSEVKKKKPHLDAAKARLDTFSEGLCVQAMHHGPYDEEPKTLAILEAFMNSHGLSDDIGSRLPDGKIRRHHEIYLSDPRKSKLEDRKTVLRHPVHESR